MAAALSASAGDFVTHSFPAIGTRIAVTYEGPADAKINADIEAIFKTLDDEASLYRNDSRLSALNSAKPGEAVAIGPMLCRLLKAGIEMTRATEGHFDITYKNPALDSVEINCADGGKKYGGTAKLLKPNVFVDLNGIAAGFAADEVGGLLWDRGKKNFLADSGGELLICGSKGSKAWTVGIEDPKNHGTYLKTFELREGCHALSTSGDVNRAIEKDGKRVSYLVDPKTGKPVEKTHLITILVSPGSGRQADALSTGLASGLSDPAFLKRMKAKFQMRIFALVGDSKTLKEF